MVTTRSGARGSSSRAENAVGITNVDPDGDLEMQEEPKAKAKAKAKVTGKKRKIENQDEDQDESIIEQGTEKKRKTSASSSSSSGTKGKAKGKPKGKATPKNEIEKFVAFQQRFVDKELDEKHPNPLALKNCENPYKFEKSDPDERPKEAPNEKALTIKAARGHKLARRGIRKCEIAPHFHELVFDKFLNDNRVTPKHQTLTKTVELGNTALRIQRFCPKWAWKKSLFTPFSKLTNAELKKDPDLARKVVLKRFENSKILGNVLYTAREHIASFLKSRFYSSWSDSTPLQNLIRAFPGFDFAEKLLEERLEFQYRELNGVAKEVYTDWVMKEITEKHPELDPFMSKDYIQNLINEGSKKEQALERTIEEFRRRKTKAENEEFLKGFVKEKFGQGMLHFVPQGDFENAISTAAEKGRTEGSESIFQFVNGFKTLFDKVKTQLDDDELKKIHGSAKSGILSRLAKHGADHPIVGIEAAAKQLVDLAKQSDNDRRSLLSTALGKHGLHIRGDSTLCRGFIAGRIDTQLEEVVSVMRITARLFGLSHIAWSQNRHSHEAALRSHVLNEKKSWADACALVLRKPAPYEVYHHRRRDYFWDSDGY